MNGNSSINGNISNQLSRLSMQQESTNSSTASTLGGRLVTADVDSSSQLSRPTIQQEPTANATAATLEGRLVSAESEIHNFLMPDEETYYNSASEEATDIESPNITTDKTATSRSSSGLYNKLACKLPKNIKFDIQLKDNENILDFVKNNIDTFTEVAIESIHENYSDKVRFTNYEYINSEDNHKLILSAKFFNSCEVCTGLDDKGDSLYETFSQTTTATMAKDISDIISNSATPSEFITNFRLEFTFMLLQGVLNAGAAGFKCGDISLFTGYWIDDKTKNAQSIDKFLTDDNSKFLGNGRMLEIASDAVKLSHGGDVIDSMGSYHPIYEGAIPIMFV